VVDITLDNGLSRGHTCLGQMGRGSKMKNTVSARVGCAMLMLMTLHTVAARAQSVTATSGLVDRTGIVYSARNDKVYVVDREREAVLAIEASGKAKVIATGAGPVSIAVNEETGRVYVANAGDKSVTVLDGSTDAVITTAKTAARPYAIAVDPMTDQVYVSNTFSDMLTVVDGKTSAVRNLKTGSADALLVDVPRGKLYLLSYESDNLKVLDEHTNTLSRLPAGAMHLWGLAELDSTLFVTHVQGTSMEAINVNSRASDPIATGAMPCAIAVNENDHEIYVANYASGSISVVNARSRQLIATVKVGGHPQAVAADVAKHRLYVANAKDSSIVVIDLQTHRVLRTVRTSGRPYALAIDGVRHRIFAATFGPHPYEELNAR
jgi:YVTN family beta-propeller protein